MYHKISLKRKKGITKGKKLDVKKAGDFHGHQTHENILTTGLPVDLNFSEFVFK